jgi:putative transcriptional regulator
MKPDLFADLLEGVKQGGEYLQGKRRPSRMFRFQPVDIRRMRKQAKLSQERFAEVLGISPATLRNWEQGRREPEGPAQRLLQVARHNLSVVLEAIHPELVGELKRRGKVRAHKARGG